MSVVVRPGRPPKWFSSKRLNFSARKESRLATIDSSTLLNLFSNAIGQNALGTE